MEACILPEMSKRRLNAIFPGEVTTAEQLAGLIGTPSELGLKKQLAALDGHMISFLRQSPFLLLGTVGADGRCDVSPRGDAPGFVAVLDRETLLIPERTGNRRADSLRNVIETGSLGVLFLIPGMSETLRINGRAQVTRDEAMLEPLSVQGKRPVVGIILEIEECFLQCGKAPMRARIWDKSGAAELPTFAQMLMDQAKLESMTTEELDAFIQASYGKLY